MKKFLTVLLVIAVMFTFSFGSAFAAGMGDSYVAAVGDPIFETLWAETVKVTADSSTIDVTTGSDEITVNKTVLAGFKAEAKAIYDYCMIYYTAGSYLDMSDLATAVAKFQKWILDFEDDYDSSDVWGKKLEAFKLAVAAAQFAADKSAALAKFDSVPTYNYSTAVMSDTDATTAENLTKDGYGIAAVKFVDKDVTYQAAAGKLVDFYKGQIEDYDDFDADVNFGHYDEAIDNVKAVVTNNLLPMAYATYDANGKVTAVAATGAYDLKVAYATASKNAKTYDNDLLKAWPVAVAGGYFFDINKDTNLWGAKAVETADKIEAANVAAVKAQNAANYADYVSKNPTTAATKYANNWLKVADILAEEGYNYTSATKKIVAPNGGAYSAQFQPIADLEYWAARYAAEKNADGVLIRDAAVVADLLEDGIVAIATATTVPAVEEAYADALKAIKGAVDASLAAELAFNKESVKKYAELLVADAVEEETYYAAELAEVQEIIDEYLAKVDAAETTDEVKDLYDAMVSDIASDVKTVAYLASATAATGWVYQMANNTGSAADVVYTAAEEYVKYYNENNGSEDDSADLVTTTLKDRIADMIGESGARTSAEIKKLTAEAVEVAKALPTQAEVKALKKAVEAAIKALPAKATIADFAAVQAVSDAIDAYEDAVGTNDVVDTLYDNAIGYIVAAYNTQYAQTFAKTAKTDEAGLKALYAEIEDAIEAIDDLTVGAEITTPYMDGMLLSIEDYLDDIRDAEELAVEKLIKAIPINVTEADIATVEAARTAYDAYVAKYTDNTTLYYSEETDYADKIAEGLAAADIDAELVSALTAAETVLGLNDNSEEIAKLEAIASVEGLKITAKSSAKKGSITVKWTVEGDDANVQYYEVRKSTKKNSGFGTKPYFTTTKMTYKNTKGLEAGTRYYFKVRAVAEIDGEVYVSDWSNKAYRVAK